MWFPPTWFASYVDVARGEMGLPEVAGVALTVLVIGFLLIALRGRLATDYSAHIGLIEDASEEVRTRHLPGWLSGPATRCGPWPLSRAACCAAIWRCVGRRSPI